MSTMVPFDARPLTDPIDPAALKAFRANPPFARSSPSGAKIVSIVVPVVTVVVVLAGLIPTMIAFFSGRSGRNPIPVVVLLVIVAAAVFFFVSRGRRTRRDYRLSRFATANAMEYLPSLADPALPGMVFGQGSARSASVLLRATAPRFVEYADYQYTTGSGKERQTHRWHYAAVRLNNRLPNIVLDAQANNSFLGSNLPAHFHRDQHLSLEGDFDRHFRLYCPTGYEADALYLFTPDVMANFIDAVGAFDVEIVDDWVFLYTQARPNPLDAASWAWQFQAVHALVTKVEQWERWRDDRMSTPATPTAPQAFAAVAPAAVGAGNVLPPIPSGRPMGVAPQGQRLRRGVNWGTWVFAGAVAAFFLLREFLPAILRVFAP
ncbi:hypothetical protein [Microbacterium gorillae]|uniref:hypothetical protein n=1 Tax=Microbacterium gorillae TaxID=1231063 RepID=UPI00059047DC|nr:hypothetical protein [Microbacterium gorillae]